MSGRFSANGKGYIQIKVKTPYAKGDQTSPNSKVQLHQLLAWNHSDPTMREMLRRSIVEQALEISHLCDNKSCANPDHLCAESSFKNKQRWGCPVVIFINNVMHMCCKCDPQCIPNPDKIAFALRYTV